jgi:hypothetical protein
MLVKQKRFKVDKNYLLSMHMTREEKIMLVLLLVAVVTYFAGQLSGVQLGELIKPLGEEIGGNAVI